MPKFPEETKNVYVPPPGRWVWDDEAHTVEFVSSSPAEDRGLRKRSHTNVNFNDIKLRSEWLVGTFKLNNRGRQSIRKSLNPHLNAYRASVMKRQGDCITIDDVKQVAVSLLQENYSFPIPFCFLAVLKSKELDEVLTALLLYLSCFFEHKSLENKSKPLMVVDSITEDRMMAEALAKKAIAQKKLAVCYFSLMMDLEMERQQHTSYHKGLMSNSTEWLLHACLYSFFCFVAWVTFGRKDLRDIQEEVGRLLYSDTFNTAVRNRTDGDSGMTFLAVNGSVKTGQADPKETGCNGTLRHRASQRRSAFRSITDQRSPLMASLLPLPKERSPHLFNSGWAKKKSPLQAERCDTKALTEQLNQRLASVSFGILGKPSRQFSPRTLIPHGEQTDKNEDENYEPGSNIENNSEDQPDIHVRCSSSSCMGPKSTGFGSTAYINTRISAATMQAVTSDAE